MLAAPQYTALSSRPELRIVSCLNIRGSDNVRAGPYAAYPNALGSDLKTFVVGDSILSLVHAPTGSNSDLKARCEYAVPSWSGSLRAIHGLQLCDSDQGTDPFTLSLIHI